MAPSKFNILSTKSVPHILENIFHSLDYETYKTCLRVSTAWRELLASESYIKRAKSDFHYQIVHDKEELWEAAMKGNIKKVWILSLFVDVNRVKRGYLQTTPLSVATEIAYYTSVDSSHIHIIQLLLERGAKPNIPNKDGDTPLHVSAKHDNRIVTQLLLERGADPNRVNKWGDTPLHIAAERGLPGLAQLLLNSRANPNKANKIGNTSLHLAAQDGNKAVIKLLLERGANPNSMKRFSLHTPLHDAARAGHKDVVQLFLNAGAEPNKLNYHGDTPLRLAQRQGHMDIVSMLE